MAAKTPREIVDFIQRETAKVLAAPDVRERLKAMIYDPVASTPAEFEAFFKADVARFAKVVADAQIPKQD